jgi:hypothetical protein
VKQVVPKEYSEFTWQACMLIKSGEGGTMHP